MRHNSKSRRHFGGWGRIVLVAIVGFATVSTPALAKPAGKRIAVLPPTDGTAKDAVIVAKIATVLKQHKIQAISGGPVKKALGVGGAPSSDGAWIALARTLKVDGMIESTISGTGAKRRVEVAVHNGADGSVAGRETFAAKGPPAKLAAAAAGGLWKKLGSAIKDTAPPKKDEAGAGLAAAAPSEAAPGAGKPEEAAPPAREPEEAAPAGPAEKTEEGKGGKAAPLAKEKEEAEEEGEEEGEDEEAGKRPARAGGERRKRSRVPRSIEVEVGGRALRRVFQYTSTSTGTAFVMSFVPVFEGHVAWFPITYAGVFVSGEYNGALKTGSNPSFPTGTRELVIGAQGRYPVSFGLFGFSAAYFQHLFLIGDTSDPNDESRFNLVWPDVAYQGARLAASGRFYIGDMVQVGVEAAYRLVTNPGEGGPYIRSSYYFPNAKTSYGVDGMAFVGVGVMPWLEIRAGVDFRRYVFGSLQPGSDSVIKTGASGATDDYLGIYAGVVGVYGGR